MRCMIQKCILNCIVINFKPTQNFDFQKTDMHFRFILFEKFPYEYIILTLWEDETYCLSFVLFGHKNGSSKFFWKIISN